MNEVVHASNAVQVSELAEFTSPKSDPPGFCRVASIYAPLEKLMFGHELERARFCFLNRLRDCRDILLLGEGDGRCLEQLIKVAPQARLHCVDSSSGMLNRAAARLDTQDRARVTFIHANVLQWNPHAQSYDAVVTVFFLDCLMENEVRRLVERVQPALRPGALWLWSDFVLPASGPARWRAQFWLGAMYGFFRCSAGLAARTLPPTEEILHEAGWRPLAERKFHRNFARSAVLSQPGWPS